MRVTPRLLADRALSSRLGLSGPGARILAAVFAAAFAAVAIPSGGPPMRNPSGWIVLGLVILTAVLLVLPWRYPLPLPLVVGTAAVGALATVVVVWQAPTSGPLGWIGWNFGASTTLLSVVALRGRILGASAGMLGVEAVTMHWSIATTGDAVRGIGLLYADLFQFSAIVIFALVLRNQGRRIAELLETRRRRAADEAAARSAAHERAERLERIRREVGPALEAIRAGAVTNLDRREHALLEATLRDRIRGGSLSSDDVEHAIRAARSRGAEIALLDDLPSGRSTLSPHALAAARAWLIDRLAAIDRGEATVRLTRHEGQPVVTFASSAGSTETFRIYPGILTPAAESWRPEAPDRRG